MANKKAYSESRRVVGFEPPVIVCVAAAKMIQSTVPIGVGDNGGVVRRRFVARDLMIVPYSGRCEMTHASAEDADDRVDRDDADHPDETVDRSGPTVASGLQFSTRTLLVITSFVIVVLAWWSDRSNLYQQTVDLQTRIALAEKWQDGHERLLMTNSIVGDQVADHVDIRLLADYLITPEHEYFQNAHDTITYPETRDPCPKCEIFYFELNHTGIEGDPFDFMILSCDGVIVAVRRGESLNS